MKLSRSVVYALNATLQLADSDSRTPVPCSQLAATGHMPERFLLHILRSLVIHGVLHSTRGVDGGYRLERSPRDISLLDVIEAIDGPLTGVVPTTERCERARHRVKLREAIEQVTSTSRCQLEAIKLADLTSTPRATRTA